MFGCIPLETQMPESLQYCLIAGVISSLFLTKKFNLSTLCFAMGISLSLGQIFARQVAKLASPAGGLLGALLAMFALISLPTISGALLWNCSVGNRYSLSRSLNISLLLHCF
jgi:hypothetical protein